MPLLAFASAGVGIPLTSPSTKVISEPPPKSQSWLGLKTKMTMISLFFGSAVFVCQRRRARLFVFVKEEASRELAT
jgi:hypothetical protein